MEFQMICDGAFEHPKHLFKLSQWKIDFFFIRICILLTLAFNIKLTLINSFKVAKYIIYQQLNIAKLRPVTYILKQVLFVCLI